MLDQKNSTKILVGKKITNKKQSTKKKKNKRKRKRKFLNFLSSSPPTHIPAAAHLELAHRPI
ncbi:hypothetical protein LguiA_032214 [Lonicera macranthoides]